jgi:hypothetical protein
MKAVVMSIAVVMVVVLLGCTEQSQMTGPVATSNDSYSALTKSQAGLKVDSEVMGPDGFKYTVVGNIDYTLKMEGYPAVLVTSVNLKITASGSGSTEIVSATSAISFSPGPGKTNLVSQSYAIGSVAETAFRVWIQYGVSENAVSLNDLRIVSSDFE